MTCDSKIAQPPREFGEQVIPLATQTAEASGLNRAVIPFDPTQSDPIRPDSAQSDHLIAVADCICTIATAAISDRRSDLFG